MCLLYAQQPNNQKGLMNLDGAMFLMLMQLSYGHVYMVASVC